MAQKNDRVGTITHDESRANIPSAELDAAIDALLKQEEPA